jgi:plasmid stabilization system protein ParE
VKPYAILAEAVGDLEEAADWYEREAGEGLGAALVDEFEARLTNALELPGAGTIVARTKRGAPVRRYRLHRFSRYAILMAEVKGVPTVVAFACSSRRPDLWQSRLK